MKLMEQIHPEDGRNAAGKMSARDSAADDVTVIPDETGPIDVIKETDATDVISDVTNVTNEIRETDQTSVTAELDGTDGMLNGCIGHNVCPENNERITRN